MQKMTTENQRHVLPGVAKLKFGPPSDIYSQALTIALSHMGESVEYQEILCASGRGFKICWDDAMFFWDRFAAKPDPDPEQYLRIDYESAVRAVERMGYQADLLLNADCAHGAENASADSRQIRDLVIAGIDEGRPVVAALSASSTRWAPEWSLITGYDGGGDTILGWSCFQSDEQEKRELAFEPEGYFRKRNWEKDTLAAVRIAGEKTLSPDAGDRQVLECATALSQGSTGGEASWGFAAYDRWASAVENEENGKVDAEILKGRMLYHRHFIGHLAAQKWYTSVYLKEVELAHHSFNP